MATTAAHAPRPLRRTVAMRFLQVFVSMALMATLLFAAAGTLRWWAAWGCVALFFVVVAVNVLVVFRHDPELAAERAESWRSMRAWDRAVTGTVQVATILVFLLAGLDARFGWSTPSVAASLLGFALMLAGYGTTTWAMSVNRFFSRVVRIQADRGHTVCDSGPYRFVRHPGYVGMIVSTLATPLALGSGWAMLPAVVAAAGYGVRTLLEDRMLHAELPGYADYTGRVRYRLMPGVW